MVSGCAATNPGNASDEMTASTSSESDVNTTDVQRGKEFVVLGDPTVIHAQNFSSLLTQDVLLELGEVDTSWFTCKSPSIAFSPTKSDNDDIAPNVDKVDFAQDDSYNTLSVTLSPILSRPAQRKEWSNISEHQCLNTPPNVWSDNLLKTPQLYGISPLTQCVVRESNLRHSTPHNVTLSLGATMGGHELSWSSSMATPILSKSMDNSTKGNCHTDDEHCKLKKPAISKKLFNSQSHLESEKKLDSVTIISLGERRSSDEYCSKLENTPIAILPPNCDVSCQRLQGMEMKYGTKRTLPSPLVMQKILLNKPEASFCSSHEQGIPAPISCCVSENTPKRPKREFRPLARNVMLDLQTKTPDCANKSGISHALPDESICILSTSPKEHNVNNEDNLREETSVNISTMHHAAIPSISCQPPAAPMPYEPMDKDVSNGFTKTKCGIAELAVAAENDFHLAKGYALNERDDIAKLNSEQVDSPKLLANTSVDILHKEYVQLENMIVAEPVFSEDSNSCIMQTTSLKEFLPHDVELPLGPFAMKVDSNSADTMDFKSLTGEKQCKQDGNNIDSSNLAEKVEKIVEELPNSCQRNFAKLNEICEQAESSCGSPNGCVENQKPAVIGSSESTTSETRIQHSNICTINEVSDVLEDQDDDLFLNICSYDNRTKLQIIEKDELSLQLAEMDKASEIAMEKDKNVFKDGDRPLQNPEKYLEPRKLETTSDVCVSVSSSERHSVLSKPEEKLLTDWSNKMISSEDDPLNIGSEQIKPCVGGFGKPQGTFTSFSTASGKPVAVSKAALKNAKNVFEDNLSKLERTEFTDFDCFMDEKKSVPEGVKGCVSEDPLVLASFNNLPHLTCKGFSTASGKPVLMSKAALDKAKIIFLDEVLPQLDNLDEYPGTPSSHLTNAGDCDSFENNNCKDKKVPELSKLQNTNSTICQGFSTASGKSVLLSKIALEKAQRMFKEDGLSQLLVSEPCKIPVSSIVEGKEFKNDEKASIDDKGDAAFHSKRHYAISNKAMEQTDSKKEVFIQAKRDSAISAALGTENSVFPTFSLASGRQVEISKSALEKARSMFLEESLLAEQTVTNSESSASLLMSVKNTLCASEKQNDVMITVDNYDGKIENTDNSTKAFHGFLTASGKGAPVSSDALQQARVSLASYSCRTICDSSSQESTSGLLYAVVPNSRSGSEDSGIENVSELTNDVPNVPFKSVPVGPMCKKRALATVDDFQQRDCKKMRCSTPVSKQNVSLSDINSRSSLKSEVHRVKCGFSLASGRTVVVAEKSLQAARNMFADNDRSGSGLQVVPSSPHSGVKDDSSVLCPLGDWSGLSEEFSHDMLNEDDTILAEKSCNVHSLSEVPSNMIVEESHRGKLTAVHNEEFSAEIMESTDALLADEITSTPGLGENRSSSWLSPIKGRPKKLFSCIDDAYHSCLTLSKNSVQESDSNATSNLSIIDATNVNENQCYWRSVPSKSLSLEVQQMRMLAVEEQLMRIEKRKRVKVSPVTGVLWKKKLLKESRQSLRGIVNGKQPKRVCQNEELMHGVKMSTLKIQSFNAGDYQFLWEEHYNDSHLDCDGIALENGSCLIFSEKNLAGKKEFYRAFLDTPGVDSKLIDENWFFNHYRWIVWKLAAMEVSFPMVFGGRLLTPEEVMLRLHYRYNCEIDFSQRSALKKITERDDTPAKTLVLCVVGIDEQIQKYDDSTILDFSARNEACTAKYIELTDGWYSLNAIIDSPLTRLVKSGQICIGQKLIIHGAELVGPTEACPPLEAPLNLALKISANCCRRAKWDTKLGYLACPKPFPLPLMSIFPDGGLVGCLHVVVARIYPIQYLEKRDDGTSTVYNDRTNNRAALQFDNRKSKLMEQIFLDVQSKFDRDEIRQKQISRRSFNKNNSWREEIKGLVSGDEIFKAMENSADPSLIEDSLSGTQRTALTQYKEKIIENQRIEFEAEIQKAVDNENEKCSVARKVVPFLKFRAIGTLQRDLKKCTGCLITLWRPGPDVYSMLKEGKALCVYYLMAETRSFSSMRQQELHLKSTKLTKFEEKSESDDIFLRTFPSRNLTSLDSIGILGFSPQFNEIDIIGLVVQIGYQEQSKFDFLYLTDASFNIAVIKFWGGLKAFGLDNFVKCGDFLLASNMQWRGKVASSDYKYLYATEYSTFSQHPKEENYKKAFNQFQNSFENIASYVEKARENITSITKQRTNASTPQQHYFGKPSSTSTPLTHSSGVNRCFDTPPTSVELVQQRFKQLSKYGIPPPLPNIITNNSPSLKSEFRTPTFLPTNK